MADDLVDIERPGLGGGMGACARPEIERLIALLSKLPGLGLRSGRRAASALLKKRDALLAPQTAAMVDAQTKLRTCSTCGSLDTTEPCAVCADQGRDGRLICVVEEVGSLRAVKRAASSRAATMCWAGGEVAEVILALPATVDDQTTAHYLADRLTTASTVLVTVSAGPQQPGLAG